MTMADVARTSAAPTAPATQQRRRRGVRRMPIIQALTGLTPLIVLLTAWQVWGSETAFTFPPPSTWWTAAQSMRETGELTPALARTLQTFLYGTGAAIAVGVVLGSMIGASSRISRALSPILEFVRSMPAPTMVPVAVVLFGVSVAMSVFVMVLAVVWPVLLSTAEARRNVPQVRLDAGEVLGLGRTSRLRKVVFPSLLPDIMIGARVSVSLGFVVSLLVDIVGSGEGLGRLLVVRQQSFDAPAVWAILVVIGAFGFVANGLVAVLEKRVRRGWATR